MDDEDSRQSFLDNPDDPDECMDDTIVSEAGDIADDERKPENIDTGVGVLKSNEPKKRKRRAKRQVGKDGDDSNDEDYIPERRSRRLQTKTNARLKERQRLLDLGLIRGERFWKEFEKKTLLTALKEFGTKEVERIIEKVPTKAPEKVKAFMQRERRNQNYTIETQFIENDGEAFVLDDGETGRVRNQSRIDLPDTTPQGQIVEILKRRERNAPIEKWLHTIEKRHTDEEKKLKEAGFDQAGNYSSIIPSMLNWIADLEPHPDPEECGGVDYAAIYRYFALLCEGEAPPDLDGPTSERVSRLLPMINQILGQMELQKETTFLENYRGPFSKYRWEEGFDHNSKDCKNIVDLSRIPGMNPLNLHPEMFTKKEIPRLGEMINIFSEEIVENPVAEESRTPQPQIGVIPNM